METVASPTVEILIDGKNVTGDVSLFLSRVTYTDRLENESDDLSLDFEDTSGKWQDAWFPEQGDSLQVKIGINGESLDCGVFEIDQVDAEFPPDIVSMKAIAAAISKELRTKNSKAFENQTLRNVAQFFADKHKLKLTGDMSEMQKIKLERKTQDKQTDLAFLASLASEYGLIFSVRGDKLVFMSIDSLESQPPALTLTKSALSRGRFCDKTADVYSSATVSVRNIKGNSVKKYSIKAGSDGKKDELVVTTTIENQTQAKAKTDAQLLAKLREKTTGAITIPGNVKLVAGVMIELKEIGKWSGVWLVVESKHTIDPGAGYTTEATLRNVLKKQ